jgi:hypothetical protein
MVRHGIVIRWLTSSSYPMPHASSVSQVKPRFIMYSIGSGMSKYPLVPSITS